MSRCHQVTDSPDSELVVDGDDDMLSIELRGVNMSSQRDDGELKVPCSDGELKKTRAEVARSVDKRPHSPVVDEVQANSSETLFI